MDISAGDTANSFQPTTQNPQSSNQAGQSQELQPGSTAELLQQRNLKISVPSNPEPTTPVTVAKPDYFMWWLAGLVVLLAVVALIVRRRGPATPRPLLKPIELSDPVEVAAKPAQPAKASKPAKPKVAPKRSKSKRKKRARR